jgi:hypothetical protein
MCDDVSVTCDDVTARPNSVSVRCNDVSAKRTDTKPCWEHVSLVVGLRVPRPPARKLDPDQAGGRPAYCRNAVPSSRSAKSRSLCSKSLIVGYCSEGLPVSVRLRAATEAAQYMHPKLWRDCHTLATTSLRSSKDQSSAAAQPRTSTQSATPLCPRKATMSPVLMQGRRSSRSKRHPGRFTFCPPAV